jgi:hypothetical protein
MHLLLGPILDKRILLVIGLCAYSNISMGGCDDSFVETIRHKLGYAVERNEWSEFVACKQFPSSEGIFAIAKRQKGTEIGDSETMGDYNLEIALVDNRTTKVLRRAFFKQRFISDGYRFDGIEIDTANYAIAPNLRAIGIRANYHIDLGFTSSQSLTLFIPSGTTYKEVLSDAVMAISFTKNWPSCTNETREATRTVSIAKEISRGYFDHLVRESLVDAREHEGLKPGDDCISSIEHKETKTYTLRFDGKHYVIPKEMREFDCRIC